MPQRTRLIERVHHEEGDLLCIKELRYYTEPVPIGIAFEYGREGKIRILRLVGMQVVQKILLRDAYFDERQCRIEEMLYLSEDARDGHTFTIPRVCKLRFN
jgi:hypothetical protein